MGFQSPTLIANRLALAPSTSAPTGIVTPIRTTVPTPVAPTRAPLGGGASMLWNAIQANVQTEVQAAVAPTATPFANIGQPGSADNAGRINGAAGNLSYGMGGKPAVGGLAKFQFDNPQLDMVLRIGLPVGGVLLMREGTSAIGVAMLAAGALLWANRLAGLNL